MANDETEDRLAIIYRMQDEFQNRVPGGVRSFKESTPEDTAADIRTQVLACMVELGEALDEVGWKPWATSRHLNVDAFRSELTDAFRFLLNLFIISGLSPQGIFTTYMESLAKTDKRVSEGYDGRSTKCPACHRDYRDTGVQCTAENHTRWCQVYGWVDDDGRNIPLGLGVDRQLTQCPTCGSTTRAMRIGTVEAYRQSNGELCSDMWHGGE